MSHAGYPWVLESCLLAWKHPNLYLELGAHRPRYFAVPGTGWEPLWQYGQSTIQDKILYGTGAFLIGRAPADLVGEMDALEHTHGIDTIEAYFAVGVRCVQSHPQSRRPAGD